MKILLFFLMKIVIAIEDLQSKSSINSGGINIESCVECFESPGTAYCRPNSETQRFDCICHHNWGGSKCNQYLECNCEDYHYTCSEGNRNACDICHPPFFPFHLISYKLSPFPMHNCLVLNWIYEQLKRIPQTVDTFAYSPIAVRSCLAETC